VRRRTAANQNQLFYMCAAYLFDLQAGSFLSGWVVLQHSASFLENNSSASSCCNLFFRKEAPDSAALPVKIHVSLQRNKSLPIFNCLL
jgi:hypothetical protein